MRSRRTGLAGLLLVTLLAGALVAGVAAGCAPAESAPVRAPSVSAGSAQAFPEPGWAAPVDGADPMAVCRAFATAMLGHDTRTDTGPEQAWRRAAPYLVDPLSTQWPQRGDARWTEWAAHRAWTLVRLDEWAGDDLPDEPGVAYRSVLASTTPVGADGWRGRTERHAVHCALIRSGRGWRVVDVVVDDLDLDGER